MSTERDNLIMLITQAQNDGARQQNACEIVGISSKTLQRWQQADNTEDKRPLRQQSPTNSLSELERQRVIATANSPEYAHLSPCKIVPLLADKGLYIASESTFYRILRSAKQLTHRERSRPSRAHTKPRALTAEAPNQIYSWDITYLPTQVRGIYVYLYLVLDIYSRKIVGWQVHHQELSVLAADVMVDICLREGVKPGQVTLHSDNGGPMKGATMLATLQELGVVPSFSRPSVSNDNPYSESLFKTLKYRPDYPDKKFADLDAARQWVGEFITWYNHQHLHSGIKFVTPQQRHLGLDKEILRRRHTVYQQAKTNHPNRFSKETRNWEHQTQVYLNPEKGKSETTEKRVA
jgi:putative transposase